MVEHVDRPGAEIGRKQEYAISVDAKCETFVDGPHRRGGCCGVVDSENRLIRWCQPSGPRRNCSVLGVEDEGGGYRRVRSRDQERGRWIGRRVPNDTGRCGGRRGGRRRRINRLAGGRGHDPTRQRDRNLEPLLYTGTVVERRAPGGARTGSLPG